MLSSSGAGSLVTVHMTRSDAAAAAAVVVALCADPVLPEAERVVERRVVEQSGLGSPERQAKLVSHGTERGVARFREGDTQCRSSTPPRVLRSIKAKAAAWFRDVVFQDVGFQNISF